MNRQKGLDRRRAGIGLLAWICFFTLVFTGSAESSDNEYPSESLSSQYDFSEFRCDAKRSIGEEDKVRVKIQNYGSGDPGGVLSVYGMQGDTVIPMTPPGGLAFFDDPGGDDVEETFYYYPSSIGPIIWHASIDGGEDLFCTTVVVDRENDYGSYSSYEFVEFRCDAKRKIDEEDKVRVKIQNYGSGDPGGVLSVYGVQEDTVIPMTPPGGLAFFDDPRGDDVEETFYYYPSASGNITWQASIDDGEPLLCTTVVGPREEDDDDSDDDDDIDGDGDGFFADVDCNDGDPSIYPGAEEICGNGTDENCDGVDDSCSSDGDGDGFFADVDCNDGDPDIYPGAEEICGNGTDENCDGVDDACDDDGGDTGNVVALHDIRSSQYDKHCNDCHADIRVEQSLDTSYPTAHRAMFSYAPGEPGDDKQCVWCHRTVDLTSASAGALRKQVDPVLCALCHGPYGPANEFYQAGILPTDPDGAALYELTCAACHRTLQDSQMGGKSAEKIQEAIDDDEGGMEPLGVLTAEEIQAIADVLAEVED